MLLITSMAKADLPKPVGRLRRICLALSTSSSLAIMARIFSLSIGGLLSFFVVRFLYFLLMLLISLDKGVTSSEATPNTINYNKQNYVALAIQLVSNDRSKVRIIPHLLPHRRPPQDHLLLGRGTPALQLPHLLPQPLRTSLRHCRAYQRTE